MHGGISASLGKQKHIPTGTKPKTERTQKLSFTQGASQIETIFNNQQGLAPRDIALRKNASIRPVFPSTSRPFQKIEFIPRKSWCWGRTPKFDGKLPFPFVY